MATFELGNQHAAGAGNKNNRMGRPRTARTIRLDTLRELRWAASPLIERAVKLALSDKPGNEAALCAVVGLLAAGYGELPAKSAKGAGDAS
jgi:hypothetical protein